jgi:predicted MFS family arabinose efflux permease
VSENAVAKPARARLGSSEIGLLALLLGANLTALTCDVMMAGIYPALAAHYRTPVETVVLLTTPRALAQLGVLLLGPLSDRFGRAAILVGGMLLVAAGGAAGALAPSLGLLAVAQVALGLGLAIVLANVPAIAADRYPYAIRGRAMAIIRLAMPVTLIAVAPIMVSLAVGVGIAAPFVILGSAATALALLAAWRLPRVVSVPPAQAEAEAVMARPWTWRTTLAVVAAPLLVSVVPTAVFSFLSTWVGTSFGNPGRTIGIGLASDGLGALVGVTLGALLIDRLTKRRAAALGLALATVFGFLLPHASRTFLLALPLIAGFSACMEVGLIGLFALLSEMAPQARGTVMSMVTAAMALGSALAPFPARLLWHRWGMAGITGAGGVLLLAVAAGLTWIVREPEQGPRT